MRTGAIFFFLLIQFVSLALLVKAQENKVKHSSQEKILFVVGRSSSYSGLIIDPIVMLDRGKYKKPPACDMDPCDDSLIIKQFSSTYYQQGMKYQLLFGGAKAGTVVVEKGAPNGCFDVNGFVRVESNTVHFRGQVMGLATNSLALGSDKCMRRSLTVKERQSVLQLARKEFRRRGVPAAMLRPINRSSGRDHGLKAINITAVGLGDEGKERIIGSFEIEDSLRGYSLFIIVNTDSEEFSSEFVRYYKSLDTEKYFTTENLVDCLDLDGDGRAEVIVEESNTLGTTYKIYKKQGNRWRNIYEGGGMSSCE